MHLLPAGMSGMGSMNGLGAALSVKLWLLTEPLQSASTCLQALNL